MERQTVKNVVRQALLVALSRQGNRTMNATDAMELLYDEERIALADLAKKNLDAADAHEHTERAMAQILRDGVKANDAAWLVWLVAPVVLVALALALGLGLPGVCVAVGVGAVLVALGYMTNGREIRARGIWRERKTKNLSASEALEEMANVLEGSAFSAVPLAMWIVVAVLLVGSVGFFAIDRVANADYYALQGALKGAVCEVEVYEEAFVGSDGVVSAEEARAVQEAFAEEMPSDKRLNMTMAAIACVEKGFPEAAAKEMATAQLSSHMMASKANNQQVLSLLECVGAENFTADMFRQLYKTDHTQQGAVRAWIAALPMKQLLDVYDGMRDGLAEKDELGGIMFKEPAQDEFMARIADLDVVARLRCLRQRGALITDPDEVLAYIRFAGSLGFTPTEVYPEGAKIDLATAACNYETEAEYLPDGLFLVMHRTEVKPNYEELRSIPEDEYTYNAKLGDAAYNVVLDTRALEVMPAECIPETMADCPVWVFIDAVWARENTLIHTTTTTQGGMNIASSKRYSPTYAAVSSVAVFEAETGGLVGTLAFNVGSSPDLPANTRYVSGSSYYLGEHDKTWIANQGKMLVDAMQQFDSNLLLVCMSYAGE